MTSPLTTERLLLSSEVARVYAGKSDNSSVFAAVVLSDEAQLACRAAQSTTTPTPRVEESDGAMTLITPAATGLRLDALAATGQLSVRDALSLVVQATEAVQEALDDTGAASVCPRPWNLWLQANGTVTLETYGLPPTLHAELEPGIASWKDSYRTPEFLRGNAAGPESDVFSLGATLLHLLTGQAAFDAGEQAASYDAIRRGEITPPSLQRAEVDSTLEAALVRAVHAEPTERFDSPEALGTALLEAGVGSVGVATRRDLRALAAERNDAAAAWLQQHPAPLGSDDPTLVVPREPQDGLEWGDDEETHVWGEEGEHEVGDDDVVDLDAPSTVVIARDDVSTTAPPIPAAASGARPSISSGAQAAAASDAVTGPSKSGGPAPIDAKAPRPTSSSLARSTRSEDTKTTTQLRRPTASPRVARSGSSDTGALKWVAMLGIVLLGIAITLLRPGCGDETRDVQLALSPADAEYRVLIDGTEVAVGVPPLTLRGLTVGQHALRVEADGFAPYEQLLRVDGEGASVVQAQLEPLAAAAREPSASPAPNVPVANEGGQPNGLSARTEGFFPGAPSELFHRPPEPWFAPMFHLPPASV